MFRGETFYPFKKATHVDNSKKHAKEDEKVAILIDLCTLCPFLALSLLDTYAHISHLELIEEYSCISLIFL